MKRLIFPLAAAFLFLTSMTMTVVLSDLKLADGQLIKFESKDPTGTFDEINGTIKFDPADLSHSTFDLSFPVSSINTGNKMKDKKAQTYEWFGASEHPNVTFKSTSIEAEEKGYVVTGDLSMKGTTKSVKVPMRYSETGDGYKFYGLFAVNRMDFHVGKKSEAVPDIMKIKYIIPTKK